MDTSGTGKNANIDGKEGTKKGKPPHKKATKASQIKTSQNKGDKANKSNSDTLLGDPMVNTKKSTYKTNEKGKKDTIGIRDIVTQSVSCLCCHKQHPLSLILIG